MPAIQPVRLKIQAVRLAELFASPAEFCHQLHGLLSQYADRTRRPGRGGNPPPLLNSFRLAPPVLRQISQELLPYTTADAAAALALCDSLWQQPWLEFRQLAAAVLGQVDPSQAEAILTRMNAWAGPQTEDRLLAALLETGLVRLRRELPLRYLTQMELWLNADDVLTRQLGLRALLPLIAEPGFENLPVLYRLLAPLLRSTPPLLRQDLLSVIRALARRAPAEAAFFLRQNLQLPDSEQIAWLIRQSLGAFPPEAQAGLRAALRGAEQARE
jgi:hypothetical protein